MTFTRHFFCSPNFIMHKTRLLFYTTNSVAAAGTSIGSISTSWHPKTAQQARSVYSSSTNTKNSPHQQQHNQAQQTQIQQGQRPQPVPVKRDSSSRDISLAWKYLRLDPDGYERLIIRMEQGQSGRKYLRMQKVTSNFPSARQHSVPPGTNVQTQWIHMPVFQMPGAYMFIRALDRLLIELNGISEYQLEPALGDRILARQVINNRTKRYDCLLQVVKNFDNELQFRIHHFNRFYAASSVSSTSENSAEHKLFLPLRALPWLRNKMCRLLEEFDGSEQLEPEPTFPKWMFPLVHLNDLQKSKPMGQHSSSSAGSVVPTELIGQLQEQMAKISEAATAASNLLNDWMGMAPAPVPQTHTTTMPYQQQSWHNANRGRVHPTQRNQPATTTTSRDDGTAISSEREKRMAELMNQVEMSKNMFEENVLSVWENAEISKELIAEDIQEQNSSNNGDEDTSEKEQSDMVEEWMEKCRIWDRK